MFSAPVTAIKILPKHHICLAGTGPYVLIFDLITNQQLLQEKVLTDSVVHGFEAHELVKSINDSAYAIVVFGQRTFSVIKWSSETRSSLTTIIPQIQCPFWIIAALIVRPCTELQSLTILFGTALNQIYRYTNSLELVQSFKYTTLYSSCLFYHINDVILFAAGTVFGELILYEQGPDDRFHEKTSVLHHNGAIFGITYHKTLLSTVGDDRTVKLYKFQNELELIASFFAHEARIWQSCLTSTHILTCGEDSSIRLWSHKSTGEMLRCFSVHRCKSVWCMDILRDDHDNKPLIIISGWSDGGVRRYHLDDIPIDSHEIIPLNHSIINDYPRNVVFLNSFDIIVQMNSGQLFKINQTNTSLFYDGTRTLTNGYAKMNVANDGNQYLAVGSLNGFVFIFDHHGTIINEFQIDINKNKKILQILWLNNTSSSKLLVCIPDGIMFIYNINSRPATIDHYLEVLPDFEQRWPNTCLYLEQNNLLIIGDRQGNILTYNLNRQSDCSIYQRFERLHGANGTSSIDIDENTNLIRSCGRDGYINIFSINNEQNTLVHQSTFTITSDIAWLDRFIRKPSLITCFTTNYFSLYTLDEQMKRRVMHVECGGGHRNHDFSINSNNDACFVYIRNKQICLARKNLMRILNETTCLSIMPPSHGTEIRCVKLFQTNDRLHMVTGSEDTQIKLFALQTGSDNSKCEHLSTLQSHLSAVCDITVIDNLIFSCGARAQVFAWQIKANIVVRCGHFMLHPLRRRHGGGGANSNDETKKDSNDDDHGLDVRFTSIAAMPMTETESYLLFVTASDSLLRIFRYTNSTNRFHLLRTCSHSDYCQLRVKVQSHCQIAFVSSTDGLLCAYDCSSLEDSIRSTSIKVHQSGINDFDVIKMTEHDLLRLISVGDDGSVHVTLFDVNEWIWKREYSKDFTHQSPATGIRFLDLTRFISIGIDQRLKLWTITSDKSDLDLSKCYLVDIRDILSMDISFCDKKDKFIIVVVGSGVQTIEFDLNSCLFSTCFYFNVKFILNAMHVGLHPMEEGDRTWISPLFGFCSCIITFISTFSALYDEANYLYCITYGLLIYSSLFFYFMTCYTDPGYVPYRRVPNWTGGMATTSDDEDESNSNEQQTATSSNNYLRKCLLCNIEQPLRSHHCDFCNRCVLKYDHHCPYLETCIGEYNHRYFWCFLLTTEIAVVWSMIMCSRSFVPFSDWYSWLHINKFRLLSMNVLIIAVCATTVLFLIHSFFALTNSTTWERVSRHRITYLNRLPDEDLNPFHQGYCRNFFLTFLCHRIKDRQWDVVYKRRVEEQVILNM